MSRNRKFNNNSKTDVEKKDCTKRRPGKKRSDRKDNYKDKEPYVSDHAGMIPLKNGDKNPNWYFTDARMADQVTQLAFQNLAGFPVNVQNMDMDIPNVMMVCLNPSPGVTKAANYGNPYLDKNTGINLAGFRFYTQLSAFTGRTSTYGPQDISTMILALGEVISCMECLRRAFGVAFTLNMRNRSYPRTVLEAGMLIDATDLFANFSDYRTRFNTLVTLVNQLPIPSSIAYFDKCQSLYEEIYLDSESSMAQTIVPMPYSTWYLDETSYSGGTILSTFGWVQDRNNTHRPLMTPQPMSYYLMVVDGMISMLLNSTTLNVVYTDIINYANKVGMNFKKLDYLYEGYAVAPRYSLEFLLQLHNATITGAPTLLTPNVSVSSDHVTPENDVYPVVSNSSLFYNPGFSLINQDFANPCRTGTDVIVDLMTDSPDVTDRVEFSRLTSFGGDYQFTTQGGSKYWADAALPDHYVVGILYWLPSTGISSASWQNATLTWNQDYPKFASWLSQIDWAPRTFQYDTTNKVYTGYFTGDMNYYTVVSPDWLRKVNNFIALGLYALR